MTFCTFAGLENEPPPPGEDGEVKEEKEKEGKEKKDGMFDFWVKKGFLFAILMPLIICVLHFTEEKLVI